MMYRTRYIDLKINIILMSYIFLVKGHKFYTIYYFITNQKHLLYIDKQKTNALSRTFFKFSLANKF